MSYDDEVESCYQQRESQDHYIKWETRMWWRDMRANEILRAIRRNPEHPRNATVLHARRYARKHLR